MVETVGGNGTGTSAPAGSRSGPPSRHRAPRRFPLAALVFPILLVAGLVLRVLVLRSSWAMPDGDESLGPIMALRAAHGHLSLLFWGGNYGGAGVTWIEAPLVAVFGLHLWIFQLVDTALTLVAVLLLRAVGRRITTPLAADVAAGTFWFFPALWVYWSEREYVFWLPALVFALATSVLALRWFETRRPSTLLWVGLCAGLAIWSYPLVVSLVLPPVAVILWTERRNWASIGRVLGAGLIGLLPWLAYFAVHGRAAFTVQSSTESRSTAFVHAITQVLPTALIGGQKAYDVIWTGPDASASHLAILGVAVYAGMVAFTVYAAVRRQVALAACGVAVVLWPFVLAVGHVPTGTATFRYGLIPIAPLLIVTAHLLAKLRIAPLLAVAAFVLVRPGDPLPDRAGPHHSVGELLARRSPRGVLGRGDHGQLGGAHPGRPGRSGSGGRTALDVRRVPRGRPRQADCRVGRRQPRTGPPDDRRGPGRVGVPHERGTGHDGPRQRLLSPHRRAVTPPHADAVPGRPVSAGGDRSRR